MIRVDFPHPFSPNRPWIDPACSLMLTRSLASTPGKALLTSTSSHNGEDSGVMMRFRNPDLVTIRQFLRLSSSCSVTIQQESDDASQANVPRLTMERLFGVAGMIKNRHLLPFLGSTSDAPPRKMAETQAPSTPSTVAGRVSRAPSAQRSRLPDPRSRLAFQSNRRDTFLRAHQAWPTLRHAPSGKARC